MFFLADSAVLVHHKKDGERGKDAYQGIAIPTDAELHMQEVSWSTQRQQVQMHVLLAFFVQGFIISKWI